jgi:hypothetical protein
MHAHAQACSGCVQLPSREGSVGLYMSATAAVCRSRHSGAGAYVEVRVSNVYIRQSKVLDKHMEFDGCVVCRQL